MRYPEKIQMCQNLLMFKARTYRDYIFKLRFCHGKCGIKLQKKINFLILLLLRFKPASAGGLIHRRPPVGPI
jgi:hypothetical protein